MLHHAWRAAWHGGADAALPRGRGRALRAGHAAGRRGMLDTGAAVARAKPRMHAAAARKAGLDALARDGQLLRSALLWYAVLLALLCSAVLCYTVQAIWCFDAVLYMAAVLL